MQPELEKQYIARQLKVLKDLTGEYPCGWYYGRLSPRSKALVHEVYKEHGIPLIWESDSYNDDLPYWVDVPAESGSEKPEGMLMVPYTCVIFLIFLFIHLLYTNTPPQLRQQRSQVP